MDTEAKTFDYKMKTLEDSRELEDVKQQHVLLRQHRQEKIADLQRRIDQKEFAGLMYHIPDPNPYREAMESDAVEEWKQAMDEEMKVLEDRGVGEEVNRPINKTVLKGRWVYKTKVKNEGINERRKGRYCAKGYSQKPGEDFDDIYALVARLESLRILLSISVKRNYTLRQLDVKSALLYGDIDSETYIELPEGYQKPGKVCQLNKAIYALKPFPCLWYFHLTEALKNMNLTVTNFDPCILVSKDLYCCIYVDDILITGKSNLINQYMEQLQSSFKCKSVETSLLLGMQIEKSTEHFKIHQQRYITEFLERFGMENCKRVNTPIEVSSTLKKATDDESLCDQNLHQSIIGSLMYAATATRPDIACATHFLGQFSSKPTETHLSAAKRLLRYLKETLTLDLIYQYGACEIPLRIYSDSSFASNLTDRHSDTGLVIQTFGHTTLWRSKKQKTVSDSTTVAEYVALAFASKQSIWVRR